MNPRTNPRNPTRNPTRKVVSLVRVSTPDQAKDDRTGIPRQRQEIDIHCREHGLTVVKEYQFDGISGAHVQQTKRFKEMLAMLSRPSIAGVVFASLDRFFRPEKLSAYDVFGPFETTGKHLFCDLGDLDSKNPQDQMKIVLWGQMGGMERLRIKERMGKGKDILRTDATSFRMASSMSGTIPRSTRATLNTRPTLKE